MTTKIITTEELKQLGEVVCVWRNFGSWWSGTFFAHKRNEMSVTMHGIGNKASDYIRAGSLEEALLRTSIAYSGMKIMMLHTFADGDWAPPEMQEWSDYVDDRRKAYEVIM